MIDRGPERQFHLFLSHPCVLPCDPREGEGQVTSLPIFFSFYFLRSVFVSPSFWASRSRRRNCKEASADLQQPERKFFFIIFLRRVQQVPGVTTLVRGTEKERRRVFQLLCACKCGDEFSQWLEPRNGRNARFSLRRLVLRLQLVLCDARQIHSICTVPLDSHLAAATGVVEWCEIEWSHVYMMRIKCTRLFTHGRSESVRFYALEGAACNRHRRRVERACIAWLVAGALQPRMNSVSRTLQASDGWFSWTKSPASLNIARLAQFRRMNIF